MKLIKPSIEWLPQEPTLEGAKKLIEIAGRTCYKSEHLITEESSEKFYNRMLSYGHGSVLEHGTIYLALPERLDEGHKYRLNEYSTDPVTVKRDGEWKDMVTTNLRVIEQNNWNEDLKYICKPTEFHSKRYTFRIITSRIISQQFMRHRVFSVSQESQRYCNYSKGKFDSSIQFIEPVWYKDCSQKAIDLYTNHMLNTSITYFELLNEGLIAEDARDVLNNGVKTEFIYTGFESDFLGNFHKLRSSKHAQELIRIQEKKIFDTINKNKYGYSIKK